MLEANLDVGRGPVATVLVDKGTLKVGDPIVAGAAWGRVRAMLDDQGSRSRRPARPRRSRCSGCPSVPNAGDEFRAAPDEKTARTVAEAREQRARVTNQRADARVQKGVKLEDIFSQIQKGEVATLNLILKADVQGSLEALTESLRKLEREDVRPVFVHRAVGGITENDITLAATTNATIIGFNVRPDRKAREMAEVERRRDPDLRDHLQDHRGHRAGDGRPAGAGVRRGRHRRSRGPRDLPGAEGRRDRRLLRALRRHHRGAQGPVPARRRDHLEGHDHVAASGSRTTFARSARASSAASACPTSRTSSRAT